MKQSYLIQVELTQKKFVMLNPSRSAVKHLGDSSLRLRSVGNDSFSLKCVSPKYIKRLAADCFLIPQIFFTQQLESHLSY